MTRHTYPNDGEKRLWEKLSLFDVDLLQDQYKIIYQTLVYHGLRFQMLQPLRIDSLNEQKNI